MALWSCFCEECNGSIKEVCAMELVKYIDKWENDFSEKEGVHVAALKDCNNVYGIEVRFPNTRYDCSEEAFDEIRGVISSRSGGSFYVSTSVEDLRSGFLSIRVAFCNHGYSDKKAKNTLQFLLEKILTDLEK